MNNKINILIYKPNVKVPVIQEIDNSMDAFQKVVDGQFQWVDAYGSARLLCSDAGKLLCLEPNILFGDDIIAGTCFFVGYSKETGFYQSITKTQQNDMIYLNELYNTSKENLMKKAKDTYYTCDATNHQAKIKKRK